MKGERKDDDDVEIIYWGEDESEEIVNSEEFHRPKRSRSSRSKTSRSYKSPEVIDWKKEVKSWVRLIVIAVLLAFAINRFVIINANVPTGSMENTIQKNTRMMAFRLAYVFSKPKRGDIIVFKYPDNEKENYVKRIIALPGEYVQVKDGVVYINDEPLRENYTYFEGGEPNPNGDFAKVQVPEGCYFVLGDNRNNSKDSRFWTKTNFVKESKILGKAIFSYYPSLKWFK